MNELPISLVNIARTLEENTFFPDGRAIDGCPYSMFYNQREYYQLLRDFLGGHSLVLEMVKERKQEEPLADENCANWRLWTVLNAMNVSRVRE